MNARLALLCLVLSMTGCAPLYEKVGLKDEASLRSPEAIPALVKALDEGRLDNEDTVTALQTLASFGRQAGPALPVAEKLLRLYRGLWSRGEFLARADAAADLLVAAGEPGVVGPLFAGELALDPKLSGAGQRATYLAALRGLGAGNYASAELASLLRDRVAHPLLPEGWGETPLASAALARVEALLGQQAAAQKKPEPVAAAAPTGIIVAVFELEDATQQLQGPEREQLYTYYATRLTELAGFKVVPRDQLRARLQEQKTESYKACYDEACQIELGKELAAEKSLSTRILKVGTTCMVTSQLYDLKSSTAEKAASARAAACNADSLLEAMDGVARQLAAP